MRSQPRRARRIASLGHASFLIVPCGVRHSRSSPVRAARPSASPVASFEYFHGPQCGTETAPERVDDPRDVRRASLCLCFDLDLVKLEGMPADAIRHPVYRQFGDPPLTRACAVIHVADRSSSDALLNLDQAQRRTQPQPRRAWNCLRAPGHADLAERREDATHGRGGVRHFELVAPRHPIAPPRGALQREQGLSSSARDLASSERDASSPQLTVGRVEVDIANGRCRPGSQFERIEFSEPRDGAGVGSDGAATMTSTASRSIRLGCARFPRAFAVWRLIRTAVMACARSSDRLRTSPPALPALPPSWRGARPASPTMAGVRRRERGCKRRLTICRGRRSREASEQSGKKPPRRSSRRCHWS